LKFEPDPREIGYAFHRAGAEIGQKGRVCKGLIVCNLLGGAMYFAKLFSIAKTLSIFLS